jgi:hypothetical protein
MWAAGNERDERRLEDSKICPGPSGHLASALPSFILPSLLLSRARLGSAWEVGEDRETQKSVYGVGSAPLGMCIGSGGEGGNTLNSRE